MRKPSTCYLILIDAVDDATEEEKWRCQRCIQILEEFNDPGPLKDIKQKYHNMGRNIKETAIAVGDQMKNELGPKLMKERFK